MTEPIFDGTGKRFTTERWAIFGRLSAAAFGFSAIAAPFTELFHFQSVVPTCLLIVTGVIFIYVSLLR